MDDESKIQSGPVENQRLLLVTGLLGAGKSTALKVLEDLGWEIIDNFPVRLLERLIDTPGSQELHAPIAIGFDSRTRGFDPEAIISQIEALSQRPNIEIATLYLDCSSSELERRYNETRRRHPLAAGKSASAGISAEREMTEPLRRWTDVVTDTSAFSVNDLQQVIRERFATENGAELSLTISSFGFSKGMPPVADFVFDMRFLDNPHWVTELRDLTGPDPAVGEYIRKDPAFNEAYERILGMIQFLLPRYKAQGKAYVHIAFGCTGGRHRSVFMAQKMAEALHDTGFSPTLLHRNLGSRAADLLERGQTR